MINKQNFKRPLLKFITFTQTKVVEEPSSLCYMPPHYCIEIAKLFSLSCVDVKIVPFEETEQYTHFLSIEDEYETENTLNIFKLDDRYEENEDKYKILKKEILDESDSDESDGSGSGSSDEDDDDDEENEDEETKKKTDEKVSGMIIDETETNLVSLRRTIYLTIQSSLDFQECAHKLLKMNIKESQKVELCQMILDACAQQRTYERFFGLLGVQVKVSKVLSSWRRVRSLTVSVVYLIE